MPDHRETLLCALCGEVAGYPRTDHLDEDAEAIRAAHAPTCDRVRARRHAEEGTLLAGREKARA